MCLYFSFLGLFLFNGFFLLIMPVIMLFLVLLGLLPVFSRPKDLMCTWIRAPYLHKVNKECNARLFVSALISSHTLWSWGSNTKPSMGTPSLLPASWGCSLEAWTAAERGLFSACLSSLPQCPAVPLHLCNTTGVLLLVIVLWSPQGHPCGSKQEQAM